MLATLPAVGVGPRKDEQGKRDGRDCRMAVLSHPEAGRVFRAAAEDEIHALRWGQGGGEKLCAALACLSGVFAHTGTARAVVAADLFGVGAVAFAGHAGRSAKTRGGGREVQEWGSRVLDSRQPDQGRALRDGE